jgi:hypothetical protein
MKRFILILSILTVTVATKAQYFEKQLGLRLGVTPGISGKIIKNDRAALEGILGFREGGVQLYGLVESYHKLIKTDKHRWMMYFGGGGHLGYINGYNRVRRWSNTSGYYYEEQRIAGMVIGLDGVIGTEYTFPKVPITMSVEFKPFVELQDFRRFWVNFWDFGFGIKYSFKSK